MPIVRLAQHLQRHVPSASEFRVDGGTVAEVLAAVFTRVPTLRGYVLDDQGAVRKHVTIFADNQAISDRRLQSDPVSTDSEIYVMQALSGG